MTSSATNEGPTAGSLGASRATPPTIRRGTSATLPPEIQFRIFNSDILGFRFGVSWQCRYTLFQTLVGFFKLFSIIENILDEARIKTGFDGSNFTLDKASEYVKYETRLENRELEACVDTLVREIRAHGLALLEPKVP